MPQTLNDFMITSFGAQLHLYLPLNLLEDMTGWLNVTSSVISNMPWWNQSSYFPRKYSLNCLLMKTSRGRKILVHPPGITDITVKMLQSIFCIITDVAIEWIPDEYVWCMQTWPFPNFILKLSPRLISRQRASDKGVKILNRCFQS